VLQCVAMERYKVSPCTASTRSHGRTLKGLRCSVLQCVALCCSVLQCVAVSYSELQCVAVSCSVLQCDDSRSHPARPRRVYMVEP